MNFFGSTRNANLSANARRNNREEPQAASQVIAARDDGIY
jgi:hypothetical protein